MIWLLIYFAVLLSLVLFMSRPQRCPFCTLRSSHRLDEWAVQCNACGRVWVD